MEVATVSTAARDSDVTVCAVGWISGIFRARKDGKSREKGKAMKGKGKGKGKKGKEKGGEKGKGKHRNSGKGTRGNWWHEHHDQRTRWNRSVVSRLWSLLEMGSQEGPVPTPSMAGASSDGTRCNGVTAFADCCF